MKAIVTIAGDSDPVDNAAEANVKVKEKAGGGGGIVENPWSLAPGKPLFFLLVIVVVIGILATVRYMLNLRGEQHTRDLYESIYGEDMVQEHETGGKGGKGGGTGGDSDYSGYDQNK
jgi:hypothetical protein